MKEISLQKIEVFDIDIIISVGGNFKDWEKFKKTFKFSKYFLKDYKFIEPQIKEGYKVLSENNKGCMACIKNEKGIRYYFLMLEDWARTMEKYDTLMHEIIHLKQFLWEAKRIGVEEIEFEAYFIESTFIKLRDVLNAKLKKSN